MTSLRDLFDAVRPLSDAENRAEDERVLQLATAVLLVEVMRSGSTNFGEPARRVAVQALRSEFHLSDDEVSDLLELAMTTSRTASDFFTFTSRVNEGFDMSQKVTMIEHLWRVAFADGTLAAHENHVMRKIADLLYIPQGAYINAKLRARDAAKVG